MRYKIMGFREQRSPLTPLNKGGKEQGTEQKSCVPYSYEKRCIVTYTHSPTPSKAKHAACHLLSRTAMG
ncbi:MULTISPECIES: hypothetical protein [unclassified Moorena]|uniref:hypothetical protein n=1 Tax=unclassified Moorena TaxID=2683338 RepID=UPI0014000799|nr:MULTISPECIES: hypothetical protein [unclassified Moorena]NEO15170.1 hypothetical protein [Moorena sp. SIO3E8]NEQ01443.1 hypothetical protein [Moorena sp. SIO3F7]